MSTYPTARAVKRRAYVERIVVGGVDITNFRDKRTPRVAFKLIEPFGYGSAVLNVPQVHPHVESGNYGTGDLSWVREGQIVKVQACDPDTGAVLWTRYRGRTTAPPSDGTALTWTVGGLVVGWAETRNRQVPARRDVRDLGWWAWAAIQRTGDYPGSGFTPQFGPTTGIEIAGAGGMTQLAWMQQLCSLSTTAAGDQWTIMPTTRGGKTFEMRLKDRTTKHYSVYVDGVTVQQNLERSEWFNTYFMTGIDTDDNGDLRYWDGLVLPGVEGEEDPPDYPGQLQSGDTGENVVVLNFRLAHVGLLEAEVPPGQFTAETVEAVEAVQEAADLPVTGIVNAKTWDALWDKGTMPWSLVGARIEPMVQDKRVRKWSVSPNGSYLAPSPNYDPTIQRRDRNVDFGVGVTRRRARQWARGEMKRVDEHNRMGTITLRGSGVIAGVHNVGDPAPAASAIVSAADIEAGKNLWLPNFEGGTLVHISEVDVQPGPDYDTVTLTVDTGYRDATELAEIKARNAESRRHPAREWVNEQRGSRTQRDTGTPPYHWKAGRLWRNWTVPANTWTVIPVFMGYAGTVSKLRIETENGLGVFCSAIFRQRVTRKLLNARVGNPFGVNADTGETVWSDPKMADFYSNRLLMYAHGNEEEPGGYWPRRHTNRNGGTTTHPITGVWQDDASFGYFTGEVPALYLAVFSDRDTTVKRGRVMWAQLDMGV